MCSCQNYRQGHDAVWTGCERHARRPRTDMVEEDHRALPQRATDARPARAGRRGGFNSGFHRLRQACFNCDCFKRCRLLVNLNVFSEFMLNVRRYHISGTGLLPELPFPGPRDIVHGPGFTWCALTIHFLHIRMCRTSDEEHALTCRLGTTTTVSGMGGPSVRRDGLPGRHLWTGAYTPVRRTAFRTKRCTSEHRHRSASSRVCSCIHCCTARRLSRTRRWSSPDENLDCRTKH
jgi:hypothetical protein